MAWIGKQRNIIDFALSSLLRRRGKNLALLTVYTVIVFVLASIFFMTDSIKNEASMILKGSPEILVQKIIGGRHDVIPETYIQTVKGITGVSAARGRLWGYYYEPSTGANYTLVASEEYRDKQGSVAIGRGVSRTTGAKKEDTMAFQTFDGSYMSLEVADVLSPESELVSSDLIEMSEKDFREILGMKGGYYTDLALTVRNRLETPVVADKIRRLLPDTRPILRDEILRTYRAVFDWRAGLLVFVFAGATLAFAIFAWDKATSLSPEERREIGILKAVGWDTSEVIILKTWEGIVISLSAFLLGFILAYLHVFFSSSVLFAPVLKGWSVLYPQFHLVPYVDPYQVATLFFLTVVPYTAATVIPSWRASIVDPDEIMRH
jgi:lipoprotein-releasing system permease protein